MLNHRRDGAWLGWVATQIGDKSCLPGGVWIASLLTLVLYIVLVPLILYLVK